MDVKRIFRSPWFWIPVAVIGVLVALQYFAPNGGYDEVDTSTMAKHIEDGSVKEITFIDGDQEIRATLDNGDKILTHWVLGQQETLLKETADKTTAGDIESYNSENPQPSLLGSILSFALPFILIIILFLFLMNQAQGGGGRVMQFAKSKAKLISKDMPKTTFADVEAVHLDEQLVERLLPLVVAAAEAGACLLYTSPSPRDS